MRHCTTSVAATLISSVLLIPISIACLDKLYHPSQPPCALMVHSTSTSQSSRPISYHTHESISCCPATHQSSLQRRPTMNNCPWQRSPCRCLNQHPCLSSAILATASTWLVA